MAFAYISHLSLINKLLYSVTKCDFSDVHFYDVSQNTSLMCEYRIPNKISKSKHVTAEPIRFRNVQQAVKLSTLYRFLSVGPENPMMSLILRTSFLQKQK